MSFAKKLVDLRKKNGYTQEDLAFKLGVTRQTISNWELDETTPNIRELKAISKEFKVSIDELLDNNIKNILSSNQSSTEKLSKIILIILKVFLIFLIIGVVVFILNKYYKNSSGVVRETSIYCKIYGEDHGITIKYDELTGEVQHLGNDSYFTNILGLDNYHDKEKIINIINDYVKRNGGVCNIIDNHDLSDFIDIQISNITETSMTIIIYDNNPNRVVYGSDFYIEKYNNGVWESIDTTGENYGFNAMAYYVDKNGFLKMNVDWTHMYGPLPKGIYRIVKNVFFESDIPVTEEDKFYIWQEFEIE